MANPLFNALGGNNMQNMPGPFGNMQNMMNAFQNFRRQFSGDPKQVVQIMLSSGQISQAQFNQAQQMAKQVMNMMGGKK